MDCTDFLEGYSDYLDGLLSSSESERFEAHRRECPRCARYDRVVQRGLKICRSLPDVDPSPDFLPRLRHRIYHLEDGIPFGQMRHGGSAALVAVAAVGLLAFAWLPFATSVPVEVELPAVAARTPEPLVSPAARVGSSSLFAAARPSLDGSTSLFFGRGPYLTPAGLRFSDGLQVAGADLFWPAGARLMSGSTSFLAATEHRATSAR
ncbi:MAG TPA: anti-sigma factor [Gemmatimonadota bacterium]|nr:anti-sigma factor [Gemmatimonadota bacterium]